MNLEAAHVVAKSHKGLYLSCKNNGIGIVLQRYALAFDKGMFTIGDDFKVIVHPDGGIICNSTIINHCIPLKCFLD